MRLTAILSILFFIAIFNYSAYAQCCSGHSSKNDSTKHQHNKSSQAELQESSSRNDETISNDEEALTVWNAVCPVLGNEVDLETSKVEYKGKLYGFCCPGCDKKFSADPEKYINNLSEDGKLFNKKS